MRATRLERQQAALLRIAHVLAEEPHEEKLLTQVVQEALLLVGGNRGHMRRWDPIRRVLVVVATFPVRHLAYGVLGLGEGLSGQAALGNEPLLLDHYSGLRTALLQPVRDSVGAAIAVALRVDARLLGTLVVASDVPGMRFTEEDAQAVIVLGSLAAAALAGQERARLDGALLAARTAAHELNNQLALTVGYSELVAGQPELAPKTQELARAAKSFARQASATVDRLQQIVRLEETEVGAPGGAVLDLERSTLEHRGHARGAPKPENS